MRYEDQIFDDGSVIDLDDAEFVRCAFRHCTVRYSGGSGRIMLAHCSFSRAVRWEFAGAAGHTLAVMEGLYAAGAVSLLENTFEQLRGKACNGGAFIVHNTLQ
jgi:hypothetical protein